MELYRPLLELPTEEDYRNYYIQEYCQAPIETFDGFMVKFHYQRFDHAFFESISRKWKDKGRFSLERAKRMSWIKDILQDKNITLKCGYDNKKKRYDPRRRACFVTPDQFVVIIQFTKENNAFFVTSFVPDNPKTFHEIRNAPIWENRQDTGNLKLSSN